MNKKLFEAFNGLDEDLLERSEGQEKRRGRVWIEFAVLAACAAIVVVVALPRGAEGPRVEDPSPSMVEPTATREPSVPTENSGDKPQDYPTASTEPIDDKPTDHGPMTPPGFHFNEAVSGPTGNVPALEESPMSALQLGLCWSVDCPTAFLEPGEPERWIYDSNLSGNFLWGDDGALRGLRLIYRSKGDPVEAVVTVSPVDAPLTTGCVLPEETEVSVFGPLRCVAWRLELEDAVLLGADFTIGDVLYETTVQAEPEREAEAEHVLTSAVTVMQANTVLGRAPDLTSFIRDDPASGKAVEKSDWRGNDEDK